jgi:hypothetical protein
VHALLTVLLTVLVRLALAHPVGFGAAVYVVDRAVWVVRLVRRVVGDVRGVCGVSRPEPPEFREDRAVRPRRHDHLRFP